MCGGVASDIIYKVESNDEEVRFCLSGSESEDVCGPRGSTSEGRPCVHTVLHKTEQICSGRVMCIEIWLPYVDIAAVL